MKTAQDIIVRPIITEDSMARIADKTYTFEVMKEHKTIIIFVYSIFV